MEKDIMEQIDDSIASIKFDGTRPGVEFLERVKRHIGYLRYQALQAGVPHDQLLTGYGLRIVAL